jgi:type VI secretion system protein ImpE
MLSMQITNPGRDSVSALIQAGQVDAALKLLQDEIRANGAQASLRVSLVQLLSVMGQWDRVRTQLQVLDSLGDEHRAWVGMMGQAVMGEALRREVFAGRTTPMILGEPPPWIAPLVQAMSAEVSAEIAARQRAGALESAPASAGAINGTEFTWLADADSRLGPVIEVLMEGKYYWVPFERISRIVLEAPTDLRHLVWLPARFTWTTGGESSGWIPCRYPGSEASSDNQIRLGRVTTWDEFWPGSYRGMGQRMLTSSADEHPLLEARLIEFHHG